MPQTAALQDAVSGYTQVLSTEGPAGLAYLNARVPHRLTGVYRLQAGVLHNVFLHDKAGEVIPEFLKAVPLGDSFCQYVLRDGWFQTCDTACDDRLNGHKYQGAIGAYYGVPLLNNAGMLYGTLCHFDSAILPLEDAEFAVLQQCAKVLPWFLMRWESARAALDV